MNGQMKLKNSKRLIQKNKVIVILLTLFICVMINKVTVYSAEATVGFGSASYESEVGNVFKVGVYIKSDHPITAYDISLLYDNSKMKYIGEESNIPVHMPQEGSLQLKEGIRGSEFKYMLVFEVIEEGACNLVQSSAIINVETMVQQTVSENGIETTVSGNGVPVIEVANSQLLTVPILLNPQKFTQEDCKLETLTIIPTNIENFKSEIMTYEFEVDYEVEEIRVDAKAQNEMATIEISDTKLKEGNNEITVKVTLDDENQQSYHIKVYRNPKEEVVNTTEYTEKVEKSTSVEAVLDEDITPVQRTKKPYIIIGVIIGVLIILCMIFQLSLKFKKESLIEGEDAYEEENHIEDAVNIKEVENQTKDKKLEISKEILSMEDIKSSKTKINLESDELDDFIWLDEEMGVNEKPIIEIKDVTMKFKISEKNSSSLKEYIIGVIKRENNYRQLNALKNINFNVYKGEIIGIIGTNGSGKSTLLKLIAGAIKPTKGDITVEQSKVQLLTLGTGFDFELTAKENIYLNGAIIGYTKKYIDEKFDDIVAFAELEGFVEEKMKNFSSGMISRLGFAIATIRENPEILILDEVLSVGDMFFRKKSDKRIKEMIQSGSTVLIVSHSIDTIKKICTRVIWIEKGKCEMIGEPEEVCKAYEKMDLQKNQ